LAKKPIHRLTFSGFRVDWFSQQRKEIRLKVTKVRIASYRGANRRPSSGDVWFDDRKVYRFNRDEKDELFFSSHRADGVGFNFNSTKRAAALTEYLDKE
jgi:hypothetical protein